MKLINVKGEKKMLSKNNVKNRLEGNAKRVPRYSLRKLNVGLASVLLGTALYLGAPANVHADVPANENQPVATVPTDNSTTTTQSAASEQASTVASSASTTQSNASANTQSSASTRTSSAASPNSPTASSQSSQSQQTVQSAASTAQQNSTSTTSATSETLSSANNTTSQASNSTASASGQSSTLNVASLSSNAALDPGQLSVSLFKAGTLDLAKWTTSETDGYLMLTGYTGDKTHIVVPNEADFEAAGQDPHHLQVGISPDVVRSMHDGSTQSIEFSNTGGKKIKAINEGWNTTFAYMPHLITFDGSGLDTSNITNMDSMFRGTSLSDLSSLSGWDVSHVTTMRMMFLNNTFSDVSPIANWNTANVNDMVNMFRQCYHLSDITPLANWNTDSLRDLGLTFGNDPIHFANFSHWNLSHVTDFGGIFAQDSGVNTNLIVLVGTEAAKTALQPSMPSSPFALTIDNDKVAMPNVFVGTDARTAIMNEINQKLDQYRASHPGVTTLTATPSLDSITNLQQLANATFTTHANASVTYQFVDDNNHEAAVGTPVKISGSANSTQNFTLSVPAGYTLAEGQTLPTSVTLGTGDTTQTIHLIEVGSITYQFVDDSGASVGTPMTISGGMNTTQPVNLNLPLGYMLTPGETLPTSVTITSKHQIVTLHVVPAITVSYQFVDDDKNGAQVGGLINVSGEAGSTQPVSLNLPNGYALASGQTLPTTVNIGNANSVVDIHLVHTISVKPIGDPVTRTITHHWVYGDGPHVGQTAAPDSVIEIYLTRMGRVDNVTGDVVKANLPYAFNGHTYVGDDPVITNMASSIWWPDTRKGDAGTPGVHVVSGTWNAPDNYQYSLAHPDRMRQLNTSGSTFYDTDLIVYPPAIPGYTMHHSQTGRSDGLENNCYVSPWTQYTNWRDEGWTPAWAGKGEKSNEDTTYLYIGKTNTYIVRDHSDSDRILSTQTLTGSNGASVPLNKTYIFTPDHHDLNFTMPTGYEAAPGTVWPTGITLFNFTNTPQTITYYVQHKEITVPHDHALAPGAETSTHVIINGAHQDDLNKTVTRTINVTAPNGHTNTITQPANVYRDATYDDVTGEVTYQDWHNGNWAAYTVRQLLDTRLVRLMCQQNRLIKTLPIRQSTSPIRLMSKVFRLFTLMSTMVMPQSVLQLSFRATLVKKSRSPHTFRQILRKCLGKQFQPL